MSDENEYRRQLREELAKLSPEDLKKLKNRPCLTNNDEAVIRSSFEQAKELAAATLGVPKSVLPQFPIDDPVSFATKIIATTKISLTKSSKKPKP